MVLFNNFFTVWPHGGPHSVIAANFLNEAYFFIKQGFAILFINFRGSLAHGEAGILSLLGNVGDFDVKDCYQVIINAGCGRKVYRFTG